MILGQITIAKPQVLLLSLLLIPAISFLYFRYKKITGNLSSSSKASKTPPLFKSIRRSLLGRTILRSLAFIFALLAFSDISWGRKKLPVHKSGSNVNFVFDISWSMMAKDGPENTSRLDCMKFYTSSLVKELSNSSFSAILAKGEGYVAIPETEDIALMENMIENLSPKLMTSAGSSLGKGIEAAIKGIPPHSSKSQYIWVFTDGDETDSLLEKALETAAKHDISVTLVGFGSEKEREITAGDGKTRVKTALRGEKLREVAQSVNQANYQKLRSANKSSISYVDSKSKGSIWNLLNQVKVSSGDNATLSYEFQPVNHHKLFIFLSILSFILSFLAGELNFGHGKKFAALFKAGIIFSSVFLTSCSSEKKDILEGVWAWYEGKYTSATADFLNTAQKADRDSLAKAYAIYGLGTTYISMGENDAAEVRLSQLNLDDENLPKEIRSAGFYNMGIIWERKGNYENAAASFRKAILADYKNLNAKINLELCQRELTQKQTKAGQSQMQGVNEEKADKSEMNSEIFNLIREQEGKKWRNMSDGQEEEKNVIDY
ncbi:MAG: VWA domain-containing protein [Treponema sp.]|nr:VWA domain-containing protein [Treponema sp.]